MAFQDLFKYDGCRIAVKLNKDTYKQNEAIHGKIFLQFNKMKHRVKGIKATLVMSYFDEAREKGEVILSDDKVHKGFGTMPYEEKLLDFTYHLPMNIPLTTNSLIYHLYIEVEYDKILNQKAIQQINIVPSDEYRMLLDVFVKDLGFQASYRSGLYLKGRQIFAFHPSTQYGNRGLNEMTVVVQYNEFYYQINFYYIIYQKKFKNTLTLYHNTLYQFDGELNRKDIKSKIQDKINQQFLQLNL